MSQIETEEISEVTAVCREGEISQTVIRSVAEAKGVDPLDLEPLYSVIDPDALNKLFRPSLGAPNPSLTLQFSMAGCDVEIRGDGEVIVTPPEAPDAPLATITAGQE